MRSPWLLLPVVTLWIWLPSLLPNYMAAVFKVTDQLTLNWRDYTGLSGETNLITEPSEGDSFPWLVAEEELKRSKNETFWCAISIWRLKGHVLVKGQPRSCNGENLSGAERSLPQNVQRSPADVLISVVRAPEWRMLLGRALPKLLAHRPVREQRDVTLNC